MADPRFFDVAGPYSLKELAEISGGTLSNDADGRTCLMFLVGSMIFTYGFTWSTVPLYRMYCQATGNFTG